MDNKDMVRLSSEASVRSGNCPKCGQRPWYYTGCDTFGCSVCDVWTEPPHCEGKACDYFDAAPEKPSLYSGTVENFATGLKWKQP